MCLKLNNPKKIKSRLEPWYQGSITQDLPQSVKMGHRSTLKTKSGTPEQLLNYKSEYKSTSLKLRLNFVSK